MPPLELTDILKVSEEEMCLLTGESTLPGGAEKLQAMGPSAVFITRGRRGVFPHTVREALPAFPVNAVDTTGQETLWLRRSRPGPDRTGGAHPGGVGIRHPCRQCCGRPDNNRQGNILHMPDSAAIQACVQAMDRCAFHA